MRRAPAHLVAIVAALVSLPALGADIRGMGVFGAAQTSYDLTYKLTLERKEGAGAPTTGQIEQRVRVKVRPANPEQARSAKRGEQVPMLVSVEKFRESWSMKDKSASVDRPKITMEVEPDTPETKALVGIATALEKAEITLLVVAGVGVAKVGGMEDLFDAFDDQKALDVAALGLFTPAQLGAALAPIFGADGATGAEDQSKGWKSEQTFDLGPAGAARVVTTWAPGDAGEGQIKFTGAPKVEIVPAQEPKPTTPRGALKDLSGQTSLAWDAGTDVIVARSSNLRIVSEWTLAGQTLTLTQTQASEASVTRVKE